MTDLLGEPTPDTPPMTAPLPWRVFKMDSCDWWIARTLDEAVAGYRASSADADLTDAHELTDADLDRLVFVDLDGADDPEHGRDPEIGNTVRRTFRQELARRVAAGVSRPEIFATTEY